MSDAQAQDKPIPFKAVLEEWFGKPITRESIAEMKRKAEADDRLREAARDLLETCEAFIAVFDEEDLRNPVRQDEYHGVFVMAKAAVAKAKGGVS